MFIRFTCSYFTSLQYEKSRTALKLDSIVPIHRNLKVGMDFGKTQETGKYHCHAGWHQLLQSQISVTLNPSEFIWYTRFLHEYIMLRLSVKHMKCLFFISAESTM